MAYKNIEDRRKYHREYMKEYRQMLKAHKMCVICAKQDAYTLIGKKICYDCLEKIHKKTGYGFRKKKKEKPITIQRHERYLYGLCYICGKKTTKTEKKWSAGENRLCEKCYQRILETSKKYYTKKLQKPICNTRNAIRNYHKLKVKNELEKKEKSLQTQEKLNQCVI